MDISNFDERMMNAALALAIGGRGYVEPNPMVGCIITRDERIIGQGIHERFGGPHAEPNALAACTEPPLGATAYVTLEPCCHRNKQTPPCVPRLIAAGVARVVVGCVDPNPAVSGRGITELQNAGIRVGVGASELAAKQLIAPFYCRTQLHRPYVTLKWAQTPDGQVGTRHVARQWISSPASTHIVHDLRARCDAILVGINTVRADDPMLNVRGAEPRRTLRRVVLDRDLSIPLTSRLVQTARELPLIVYCCESARAVRHDDATRLEQLGAEVIPVPLGVSGLDLPTVMEDLHDRGVTHLLVEPGPTLARSFVDANLADRAWIIYSSRTLPRSEDSIEAIVLPFQPIGQITRGDDRVVELLNTRSAGYFAALPSADWVTLPASGATK